NYERLLARPEYPVSLAPPIRPEFGETSGRVQRSSGVLRSGFQSRRFPAGRHARTHIAPWPLAVLAKDNCQCQAEPPSTPPCGKEAPGRGRASSGRRTWVWRPRLVSPAVGLAAGGLLARPRTP